MIRDLVLKALGIDEKINEAHHLKNVATSNLGKLEMERRKINKAITEIKRAVDRQETIINDTAAKVAIATGGLERGIRK